MARGIRQTPTLAPHGAHAAFRAAIAELEADVDATLTATAATPDYDPVEFLFGTDDAVDRARMMMDLSLALTTLAPPPESEIDARRRVVDDWLAGPYGGAHGFAGPVRERLALLDRVRSGTPLSDDERRSVAECREHLGGAVRRRQEITVAHLLMALECGDRDGAREILGDPRSGFDPDTRSLIGHYGEEDIDALERLARARAIIGEDADRWLRVPRVITYTALPRDAVPRLADEVGLGGREGGNIPDLNRARDVEGWRARVAYHRGMGETIDLEPSALAPFLESTSAHPSFREMRITRARGAARRPYYIETLHAGIDPDDGSAWRVVTRIRLGESGVRSDERMREEARRAMRAHGADPDLIGDEIPVHDWQGRLRWAQDPTHPGGVLDLAGPRYCAHEAGEWKRAGDWMVLDCNRCLRRDIARVPLHRLAVPLRPDGEDWEAYRAREEVRRLLRGDAPVGTGDLFSGPRRALDAAAYAHAAPTHRVRRPRAFVA